MPKSQNLQEKQIRLAQPIFRASCSRVALFNAGMPFIAANMAYPIRQCFYWLVEKPVRRFFPWLLSYQAQWHEADLVIAGANPFLACLIASQAVRRGLKILLWSNHQQDEWPDFLCQEATFRHVVEQALGWRGPDQTVWQTVAQQTDDIASRFTGRADQADLLAASVWCQELAAWSTKPLRAPMSKARLDILQGTGRLSKGVGHRIGDEQVLYADLARQHPVPVIRSHDNPLWDITQTMIQAADYVGWHPRPAWSRVVFARHVVVVADAARPALLSGQDSAVNAVDSSLFLGTARSGWAQFSLADRARSALQDVLEIPDLVAGLTV